MNRPKRSTAKVINYAEPVDDDAHDAAPLQAQSTSGVEAGREKENGTVADKHAKGRPLADKAAPPRRKASSITSRLPVELVEHILDFVSYLAGDSQPTLAQCCLVSRSFRQLARKRFYRTLRYLFLLHPAGFPEYKVISPPDQILHNRLGWKQLQRVHCLTIDWWFGEFEDYSVQEWARAYHLCQDDPDSDWDYDMSGGPSSGDDEGGDPDQLRSKRSLAFRIKRRLRSEEEDAGEAMNDVVANYKELRQFLWLEGRLCLEGHPLASLFATLAKCKKLQVLHLPFNLEADCFLSLLIAHLRSRMEFTSLLELSVPHLRTEDMEGEQGTELAKLCEQRGIALLQTPHRSRD